MGSTALAGWVQRHQYRLTDTRLAPLDAPRDALLGNFPYLVMRIFAP